jgi:hypothetical protein
MRADAALADRNESVREAARDWLQAGWINGNALEAIAQLYPDDRVRTGPAFRILFFVLTVGALLCVEGIFLEQYNSQYVVAASALALGIACAAATNYLINYRKRRQGGIEAAFSFMTVSCLILSVVAFTGETGWWDGRTGHFLEFLIFAILTGAAASIWGYRLYAIFSAVFLFAGLMNFVVGRIIWLVLALLIYSPLSKNCVSIRWPPALRKSFLSFLAVTLLALYAAFNLYLADGVFFTFYFDYVTRGIALIPRWVCILLTGLLPILIFLLGILRRRRLLMNLGFLLAVLSLITLLQYVQRPPLWILLSGGGLLLLAIAEVLRRYLNSGTNNERSGFTANLLTEDPEKRRILEMAVSVAAVTPQQGPSGELPRFSGDGGKFGGGGASSNF